MKSSRPAVLGSLIFALLAAAPAFADLNNCENLYVGRIWVERGYGLRAVVLMNTADAGGGSYWSYFDNWTPDERKSALATLTAAKLAGHRVNVITENADGCGLLSGGTYMKMVFLATNP